MRQLEVAGVPIVRSVGRTGGQLVPPDRVTHTRIHFYTLRLAKSDVFTPRLWEWQWAVDQVTHNICGSVLVESVVGDN